MFLGANRVIWHGVRIEILYHWCEFEKHKKKFWPGNGALKRHLPYGKVKFQKHIFTNPMVDSDSSWKSVYTKCPSFSNIPIRSGSKIEKTAEIKGKFNLPTENVVFVDLTNF